MQPLTFQPILKRIRWGGRRLGSMLGKPIGDGSDWAESWEIADHGSDQSRVVGGFWQGESLRRIMELESASLIGDRPHGEQFPLLVKFLDASDRLSVQVHPNDAQAHRHQPGENGKTEAWVILDAQPGSRIYAGLKEGVCCDALRAALQAGDVEGLLHSYEVTAGDCVLIPAGTVHAIGEGILLAEIQQQSNLTFRLHDWGRTGSDGKPRELHVAESLDCTDFDLGPVDPVTPLLLSSDDAYRHEHLASCEYFVLDRHTSERPFVVSSNGSCRIVLGLAGRANVWTDSYEGQIGLGNTLLIPADSPPVHIEPDGAVTLLDAHLPVRSTVRAEVELARTAAPAHR